MDANGLIQILQETARGQAAHRGAGYAIVHEDMVGGLANVEQAIADAQDAGADILVSAGERDRFIQLRDVRVRVQAQG